MFNRSGKQDLLELVPKSIVMKVNYRNGKMEAKPKKVSVTARKKERTSSKKKTSK